MNENEIRAIVLFFSLISLDDALAVESAGKALSVIAERGRRRRRKSTQAEIVSALHQILMKDRAVLTSVLAADSSAHWAPPPGLDLSKWRDFRRTSPPDEIEILVLVNVLAFPEEDVARGLDLSLGTVRYRQARALSRLGALTPKPVLRSL